MRGLRNRGWGLGEMVAGGWWLLPFLTVFYSSFSIAPGVGNFELNRRCIVYKSYQARSVMS
jgi:hypothetical protein